MFDKKEYYQKNKERIKEYRKHYYQNNIEKVKEYDRIRYERNRNPKSIRKPHHKEYMKEWFRLHREERRKYMFDYRNKLREKALELIGNTCVICGYDKNPKKINFHEKSGKAHVRSRLHPKLTSNRYAILKYYIEHPQDFIPMCAYHHTMIHNLSLLPKEKIEKILELIEVLR